MKLLYVTGIWLLSTLVFHPVHSVAQDWHSLTRAQMDSILNPKVLHGADKLIRFEQQVTSIGRLSEDDAPVNVAFPFQNISRQPLSFTRITTDCGCTEAEADKITYQPEESGQITVQYHPKNHVGTIDASIWVYSTASNAQPIAKLTILGEVLPGKDYWKGYRHAMGALRIKQDKLHFVLQSQGVQTERILCANSGTEDMQLSVEGLPPYIRFRTEPSVIKPGEEADIVVRIDASQWHGGKTVKKIPLVIQGLSVPQKERTLFITVEFQ